MAFGATKEACDRWEPTPEHFEVLTENWPAVRLFILCGTQWRRSGMDGTPTGLDYAGVEAAARMHGEEITAEIIRGVAVMERAAMDVWLRRSR